MKQTLVLLAIICTLISCDRPKDYKCVCKLYKTEYGVITNLGTEDTILHGKKEEAQAMCKEIQPGYSTSTRNGVYTLFRDALCDIE